jgi:hypothetical protein
MGEFGVHVKLETRATWHFWKAEPDELLYREA